MTTAWTASEAAPSLSENGRSSPSVTAGLPRTGDFLGRHRLSAAISRLEQEIVSLEKELEELDTMEPSSVACEDILFSMNGLPDALLPITTGPENSAWERWFRPVRSSRNRAWWAHRSADLS
ncbi:hypothetical protein KFK09_006323 [Dendrobium nobile]|uniref:G protein gamma domain-containing protein n=2 Tax=Dendrobium TaxID=37818 RepID=A0A8T3BRT1_DENNO|nr:hypothetical protein KFK09_006323 [Dendrobium nobile]